MNLAQVRVEGGDALTVHWGLEVTVDHRGFGAACGKACDPLDVELLRLAGLICYADRVFRRKQGRCWTRRIAVSMPVCEPHHWASPKVTDSLQRALEFVTGDAWSFEWLHGSPAHVQLELAACKGTVVAPRTVALFSGGLDSFLLWRDLLARGDSPLLVTAQTSSLIAKTTSKLMASERRAAPIDVTSVGVPIRLQTGTHAEPTFRSRTFSFACAAAVAARLSGAQRIAIAENGQGSLGASLVPFGAELPYRNTHPIFTSLFSRFIEALRGRAPSIEHPYLWMTKGAVLRNLIANDRCSGWEQASSCSRDLRRQKGVVDDRACGICGNCLLRRVAVFAAQANDNGAYHWNLAAPSVREAARTDAARPSTQTDVDLAARSVMSMDAFANLERDDLSLRRAAFAISEHMHDSVDAISSKMMNLRDAHATEWFAFLATLPVNSWIFRYTERAP